MKRHHDWELRLAAYLDAVRSSLFTWGGFDCCTFPCNGVMAISGVDVMASLRGRYTTEREAYALLAATAGDLNGVATLLLDRAGAPEIPVLTAGRGDLVLADLRSRGATYGPCLGLVGMSSRAAFAAPRGYAEFPLRFCARAWRV